jgi:hypothetical protein
MDTPPPRVAHPLAAPGGRRRQARGPHDLLDRGNHSPRGETGEDQHGIRCAERCLVSLCAHPDSMAAAAAVFSPADGPDQSVLRGQYTLHTTPHLDRDYY